MDEIAEAPFVSWRETLEEFSYSWEQGDHLTIIGPTKQGKTTFALQVLRERARLRQASIVVLATKPRDPTLQKLKWPVIREWPPGYGQDQVIYWPKFGDVRSAAERQRKAFHPMLAEVFRDGGRTVYFDEAYYFAKELRLDGIMKQFWQAGRTQGITVVAGTQRPRDVPRQMFSECSWFVAFKTPDLDEARRVGQIGGIDYARIRGIMERLKPHEFLIVQTRTGQMLRSKVVRGR